MVNTTRTESEMLQHLRTNSAIHPNGCWIWMGAIGTTGYGKIGWGGKIQWIDHTCHNRACNNPDHLRLTTPKQNNENRSVFNAKSGIRGVVRDHEHNRWAVYVKHQGKTINGGRYLTIEAAERAAIELRNQLFTHNDLDRDLELERS